MAEPKFTPTSQKLRLVDRSQLDTRSDEEIVAEILSDRLVTSVKNVWAFWDKGWDNLQSWRKRNVISWARKLGPSWSIRVVDTVLGSPRHVTKFVPRELLPSAVLNGEMKGRFAGQHSAVLQLTPYENQCLLPGNRLDVSFILLRHLDDVCWNAIADEKNPQHLAIVRTTPLKTSEIWKNRDSCTGVSKTPLFDGVVKFETNELWKGLLGQVATTEYLNDYWAAAVSSSRLLSIHDRSSGLCGAEYFRQHCRVFDMAHIYPQHSFVGGEFDENEHIKLLSLPRSEPVDRSDPTQLQAERLVEGILTEGICKSVSQGAFMEGTPSLGAYWTEHDGADIRPGTWAEYLRWGAVNLEPTKAIQPLLEGMVEKQAEVGGEPRIIWKTGLLEPIVPGVTDFTESWGSSEPC